MFDSISIGTSSLLNHAKGLRVVGNNLANVNTPGFKSSQLQFSDMFAKGSDNPQLASGDGNGSGMGTGVASLGAQISFRAGVDQTTGNPLDVAIDGNGFFVIKRDDELMYTRSGDFRFDQDGILVNSHGDQVMGLNENGQLVTINVSTLDRNPPKQTANVVFEGALSSPATGTPVPFTLNGVTVIDAHGVNRSIDLRFTFTRNDPVSEYAVDMVKTGADAVPVGTLKFVNGQPMVGFETLTFDYKPGDDPAMSVKLDFAKVTTVTTNSTLGVKSQDGYALGLKTDQSIGQDGTIKIMYSNGKDAKGQRIALADFQTDESLVESTGGAFFKREAEPVSYGYAGDGSFGKLNAGHREGSNVDLAEEFGNLILMQRGYQAASHVISTANDMIQQLFDMKGR
jgi:flagellar hook protein FlgE